MTEIDVSSAGMILGAAYLVVLKAIKLDAIIFIMLHNYLDFQSLLKNQNL